VNWQIHVLKRQRRLAAQPILWESFQTIALKCPVFSAKLGRAKL
jgi:hypothetical protein